MSVRFMDVHYWPTTGKVIVVHGEPAYGENSPVVTFLDVTTNGNATLPDTTFLVALAMAEAAKPVGQLFEHNDNVTGARMTEINICDCFARVVIVP